MGTLLSLSLSSLRMHPWPCLRGPLPLLLLLLLLLLQLVLVLLLLLLLHTLSITASTLAR